MRCIPHNIASSVGSRVAALMGEPRWLSECLVGLDLIVEIAGREAGALDNKLTGATYWCQGVDLVHLRHPYTASN